MFEQELTRSQRIKRSKYFLPTLLLIGAGGIAALLLVAKPEVEKEENEFPPLVVEVSEASLDEKLRSTTFQGEVRAKTDIELVTQVTGKVTAVSDKFIEGGQFEKGEVILQIDDSDYRVALKSAEASVAEAAVELEIELASAETNKREWQDLVGESLDKANPLRLNKPQVQRARARLDAAKAQLAQAKLDFNRTRISAPFTGRILSKAAELGQFVARGSSVGRIFSTDSVEIRIAMSDSQISELGLSLGQVPNSTEDFPAKVMTQFGNKNYHWQGYLRSIDASVDSETRLLFGTIVVDRPFELKGSEDFPLAPGLYVDVELDAAEKIAGVSVPRMALRSGTTVYVVKDNKVRFKSVNTIFTSPEVAVLSVGEEETVLPGDLVITSPVPAAFDGMEVKIKGAGDQHASEKVNDDDLVKQDEHTEQALPDDKSVDDAAVTLTSEQTETMNQADVPLENIAEQIAEKNTSKVTPVEDVGIEPVKTSAAPAPESGSVENSVTPI